MPQDQTSLIKMAQTGLDHADEVGKSIDSSTTWEGVLGRIKWVMDTLSPVAGVRVILVFPFLSLTEPTPIQLHPIAKMAYGVLSVIPQVRLFASLFEENALMICLFGC